MRRLYSLLAIALVLLLIACVVAAYLTRGVRSNVSPNKQPAANAYSPVDQRFLQNANEVNALADMADQQASSREGCNWPNMTSIKLLLSPSGELLGPAPHQRPLKQLSGQAGGYQQRGSGSTGTGQNATGAGSG
jgi:hypothetical protein